MLAHPELEFEIMVHPALPSDSDLPDQGDAVLQVVQAGQVQEVKYLKRLQEFFRTQLAAAI